MPTATPACEEGLPLRDERSLVHYSTDIPLLGYATVSEPSQPPPGEYPTQAPMCPIYLLDRLTSAVIDHCCAFTNISTSLLNMLFPNKWQQWLKPTNESLKSASHHKLKIIGRIPNAKMEIGSVELIQDVQVVDDERPLFLVGNDVIYDRITNHDNRFITVRCKPKGPAREIVPISYGQQVVYASLNETVTLRPHKGGAVMATIVGSSADREECDFINSFRNSKVKLDNIRYGPSDHIDEIASPPVIDETVKLVDSSLNVEVQLVNDDYQFRTFEKGTLVARVTKIRIDTTQTGSSYVVYLHSPDSPTDLINQSLNAPTRTNTSASQNCGSEKPSNFFTLASSPGTDPARPGSPNRPNVFLLPSHDEDFINILQGSDDGDIPLPGGYELDDFPSKFDKYSIDDIQTPHLTPEQRERFLEVCKKYPGAFAEHSGDVGRSTYGEFDMTIGDKLLKPEPYRPCPKAYVEEVDEIISRMIDMKIVGLSESPYATNLVVARKPNSKLRVCLDSRGVNLHLQNITAWPIPPQEESLEKLAKANFSTSLDILSAFWSVPLSARAQPLTAFYWESPSRERSGLYMYLVAPFGIRSLPGYFNSLMAHLTRGMGSFTYFFFDDLLIFSLTLDAHLEHLDKVLARICESGFKLRPTKCQIGVPKSEPLKWLGNVVVNGHLVVDPLKIKAVQDLPIPTNGKELLRGLSLVSYLRKFLPHLATVVSPLHDLVNASLRKINPEFSWLPIHSERFELMKQMVTHAPALRLINVDNPLIICSDASKEACGCLISMIEDTGDGNGPQEYVCGYASRRFTSAEKKRLTIPEREMTGILYAVNCWSQYLVGRERFTLRTDASALLYLHAFKTSSPRLMKASLHLSELNYEVEHMSARPGNSMEVCDFLSRAYSEIPEITLSWQTLRNEVFDQIRPPPNWPKHPLSKDAFASYADEFFRTFNPSFPTETKELDRRKITYFYRDLDNPAVKQQILDRERELRQEYYRQMRTRPEGPPLPLKPSSLPPTTFHPTNTAEPPSSDRSPPPSHVSSQPSFFSVSGEDSDSEYLSAYESDSRTSATEHEGSEPPPSALSHHMVNFYSADPTDDDSEPNRDKNAATTKTMPNVPGVGQLTPSQMTALQRADVDTLRIINRLDKMTPEERQKTPFFMRQGVLCRHMRHRSVTYDAVALPKVLRLDALRMVHGDGFGTEHLGLKKTLILAHRSLYWPKMADDIKAFVQGCVNCVLNQPSTARQVEIQRRMGEPSLTPNSRTSVDLIINLPTAIGNYKHIAVFVCNFSRFVVLCPLRTKTPDETARAFLTRYVSVIGLCYSLHSDAGSEVDAAFMQRFCRVLNVRKSRTPSYTPNANGVTEAINRSVGSLLRTATFPGHLSKRWPTLLPFIALTLNETPSTAHGFRPRQLMFGCTPSYIRLPLVSWDSPIIGEDGFLQATRAGQQFAWDAVRAQQMRVHSPQEKSRRKHPFTVGSFVAIKDHAIGAPQTNKLKTKYKGPYRVLQAYTASLVVQRWLGADDPLVTQGLLHHHRIDAKHVECQIVSARDCKLYPNMEKINQGPGVNPELIRLFLKQLGLPTKAEDTASISEGEGPYAWDADPDAIRAIEEGTDTTDTQSNDPPAEPDQSKERNPEIRSPLKQVGDDAEGPGDNPVVAVPPSHAQELALPPPGPQPAAVNTSGNPLSARPDSPASPARITPPADAHSSPDPLRQEVDCPTVQGRVSPSLGNGTAEPPGPQDASGDKDSLPVRAASQPSSPATTPVPQESPPPGSPPLGTPAQDGTSPALAAKDRVPSPEPLPARRQQPSRATKSEWLHSKWQQTLKDLRPRMRHRSAPLDSSAHLSEDALLIQDMARSREKNDPRASRKHTPSASAERMLYDNRISRWITHDPEEGSDPVVTGPFVTQHEQDEKSEILDKALGTNSQRDTKVNPVTPPALQGDDPSERSASTPSEKPVSEHSYVNVPH